MRRLLFVLVIAFTAGDAPAQSARIIEAHQEAMEASDKCKKAWLQSTRKDALATIEKSGTTIALSLDPLSIDAERHQQLLEDVTHALRECTELTFTD
jgi:hypothetical protein